MGWSTQRTERQFCKKCWSLEIQILFHMRSLPHPPPQPSKVERETCIYLCPDCLSFFHNNQKLRRQDAHLSCRIWSQTGCIRKYQNYQSMYSISVFQSCLFHMRDNIHWVRGRLSHSQSSISQAVVHFGSESPLTLLISPEILCRG